MQAAYGSHSLTDSGMHEKELAAAAEGACKRSGQAYGCSRAEKPVQRVTKLEDIVVVAVMMAHNGSVGEWSSVAVLSGNGANLPELSQVHALGSRSMYWVHQDVQHASGVFMHCWQIELDLPSKTSSCSGR